MGGGLSGLIRVTVFATEKTCANNYNLIESISMITSENKKKAIKATQTHANDVGSPQAQIAILTARIRELTEHMKQHKHDFMARRGLIQMVGRRKRLLKSLEKKDFGAYKQVVATLGLRK